MSQLVTSLMGIISLPLLTKTYTSETYGVWTQVNVTVGLTVPILTLQFGTSVVRFLAGEGNTIIRRRSMGAMLYAILIVDCLTLIITNSLAPQISIFLFNSSSYTIFVRITSLWISFESLFAFFLSYLRARGKMKQVSLLLIAVSVVKGVFIVSLAILGLDLEWIIISMVSIELFFALVVIFLIVRDEGFPPLNFEGIGKFLAFSVPQIPTTVLGWAIAGGDRYIITHFLDLSQTGIYSTSNLLGGLVSLFCSPINYVLLPAVSRAWEQNRNKDVKEYFEYSIKLFLTMAIPGATGLALLSQPLLKILTTSEYLVGSELVLFVAVGAIFSGIFGMNVYTVYLLKQTKWLPFMMAAATATNIGLNLTLTPNIGILGAAISNIVSYFMLSVIIFVWVRKKFNYSFHLRYLSKVIIATLIMAVFLYYFKAGSVLSIISAAIFGIAIFSVVLLFLRAFSEQDKRLIKKLFGR